MGEAPAARAQTLEQETWTRRGVGSQGARRSKSEPCWSSYYRGETVWVAPGSEHARESTANAEEVEPGANPCCHWSADHRNRKWKRLPSFLVLISSLLRLPGFQVPERKVPDRELWQMQCAGPRARSQSGLRTGAWSQKGWKIGTRGAGGRGVGTPGVGGGNRAV